MPPMFYFSGRDDSSDPAPTIDPRFTTISGNTYYTGPSLSDDWTTLLTGDGYQPLQNFTTMDDDIFDLDADDGILPELDGMPWFGSAPLPRDSPDIFPGALDHFEDPTEAMKKVDPQRSSHRAQPVKPRRSIVPSYTPDKSLNSATACREYLAHPDPADTHHIELPNDDWKMIKDNHFDAYVGLVFDSLLHQSTKEPPKEADIPQSMISDWEAQQERAHTKVSQLLETTTQIKAAKARCGLLVDAVIHFHEHGCDRATWEAYDSAARRSKVSERKHQIDVTSVCSTRLTKTAEIVKSNKLIAMDVLTGTNLGRIAQNPDLYRMEKLKLFQSNARRQARTDSLSKLDSGKQRVKKGKKRGRIEATESGLDGSSDRAHGDGLDVAPTAKKRVKVE